MNFQEQINNIRSLAIQKIKENGSKVIFNSESDELFDMPFFTYVDKYLQYDQYAIKSYMVEEDTIIFLTESTGENCDEMTFSISELETEMVCQIADNL
jgi:hypothetical protein